MWTPDEIALAQEVADRIWATLEYRKAEAELAPTKSGWHFFSGSTTPSVPWATRSRAGHCRTAAAEHLGVNRSAMRNSTGVEYVFATSTPGAAHRSSDIPPRSPSGRWTARCAQRGEPIFVNDVETDPRFSDSRPGRHEGAANCRVRRRTLFKDGRMVAAFGANQDTPRVWTRPRSQLVRDVARTHLGRG